MKNKKKDTTAKERTQWHRLIGLILRPLFTAFGYKTEIEVDLSLQKQLVDIIVVREKKKVKSPNLPKEFWEIFDNFNEHNLISFKSYSESFNLTSVLEVSYYLISYCKLHEVKPEKVNLYAIVHHYPKKLLKPYEDTKFLKVIKKGEIIDLNLKSIFSVRFIITRVTQHPILSLFSGDKKKVFTSYDKIEKTWLLDNVSTYFQKVVNYHGQEFNNMYTEKDFLRDNPPTNQHFSFPWEESYHNKQIQKIEGKLEQERRAKERERRAKKRERIAKEKEIIKNEKASQREKSILLEVERLKKQIRDMKKY